MVNFVYEVRNINDPILGETPRFASDKEAFDLAKEFEGAEVYALCYDEDWNLVREDKITEDDMNLPDGCDSCSGDDSRNYDDEGNFRLPETDDDLDEELKEYFFPKEFYDRFKWFRGSKADCLNFRNEFLNDSDWIEIVKEGNTENNEVPEYTINFTKDHLIKPELWDTLEHETIGDELKAARAKDESIEQDLVNDEAPVDECVKEPEKKELVKESLPPFKTGAPLDFQQLEYDYANDDVYYKDKKVIAFQEPHELAVEFYNSYINEEGLTEQDLANYPMCENGILTKEAWTKFIDTADPNQYWLGWADLVRETDLTETDLIYEGGELPVDESVNTLVQESKKIVESREPVELDVRQIKLDWANDDIYYKGNKIIAVKVDPKEWEEESDQYTTPDRDKFPMCKNGYLTKEEWNTFINNAEDPYWMSWPELINERKYDFTEADLVYEGEELPVNESCGSCKECGSCETQEDDDTLFNENFTPEENEEFENLSKTLGFKDFKDVLDFSKDHGSVFDRELLQSMREEAEKLASTEVNYKDLYNKN